MGSVKKTEEKQPEVIGQADSATIEAWKEKHPNGIFSLTCKDDEGNLHVTYVKKPTLDIVAASAKHLPADPIRSGKVMFNSCRLGGSDFVTKDDESRAGVIFQMKKLFKIRQQEVKKL